MGAGDRGAPLLAEALPLPDRDDDVDGDVDDVGGGVLVVADVALPVSAAV